MKKLLTTITLLFLAMFTYAQFVQQGQKLVNNSLSSDGGQGFSVDLSSDGNTMIVGVPLDGETGGALIYTRSNGTWTQQGSKLIGTGYTINTDALSQGSSVAISGDGNTVAIGDRRDNNSSGAVYVFKRTNGVWNAQGNKIVLPDPSPYDYFGWSVDLSYNGNRMVVGAPGITEGSLGREINLGGIFVFERVGNVWNPISNRLFSNFLPSNGNQFYPLEGYSVAISGDGNTLAAGAPGDGTKSATGSVVFWKYENNDWSGYGFSFAGKGLGQSVALNFDGTIAAVGQPNNFQNSSGTNHSKVKIYRFRGVWENTFDLFSSSNEYYQGNSVSLSADGNRVIFNASSEEATIFNYSSLTNSWSETNKLYQGTGAIGIAAQGYSLAISGDGNTFAMGGRNDNNGKGAVWVFANQATGISKEIDQSLFNLFPNPTNNIINIEFSNSTKITGLIFIYDQLGNLVMNNEMKSNTKIFQTDLSNLPNGHYFAIIEGENFSYRVKIIKE